jgi:Zn finger protein HypA/HybF involved in hydrogenase expression
MTVELVCESCGHRHKMGERDFDEAAKRMVCPKCGTYPFSVDRGDLSWHPPVE